MSISEDHEAPFTGRRILYFAASTNKPLGGIKQCYRHVEILRRNGCDAYVLHRRRGFRVTWFESSAPTLSLEELDHQPNRDIVVVPEDMGREMFRFPAPRVIFNQNVYRGFVALEDDCSASPYLEAEMPVLTVSEHNQQLLRFAFPTLQVERVICGLDSQRFRAVPLAEKTLRIVCPRRKAPDAHLSLFQLLMSRAKQGLNQLADLEWVFLDNRSEEQVATLLSESMFLVFATVEEGFGLLMAEAVLSGCIVLSHPNGPQREFLPDSFLFPEHDLLAMARSIESVVAGDGTELFQWQAISDAARAAVETRYSLEAEEASVLAAWTRLLQSSFRPAS